MIPAGLLLLEDYDESLFAMSEYSAVHYRMMFAARDRIREYGLAGIDNASINVWWSPAVFPLYIREQPPATMTLPGVMICPWGKEEFAGGTNLSDDIGYPTLVAIVDRNPKDADATWLNHMLPERLLWRERAIGMFRQKKQRLANVREIQKIKIETADIANLEWLFAGQFFSAFVLRGVARQRELVS